MPHDVIMPMLGMSQDTGRILAWRKAAGDAVRVGDALMEIETDKAVVEIEAEHDGILSEIRAPEGAEVPVGQVVAVIAAAGAAPQPAPAPKPEPEPEPKPQPKAPEPAPAPPPPAPQPESRPDRILASPLARRRAAEAGIDLHTLVAQGIAQPIHLRDLPTAAPAMAARRIVARADDGLSPLLAWAEAEGRPIPRARLIAAIVAAAWRSIAPDGPLIVALAPPGGPVTRHADPDRGALTATQPEPGAEVATTVRVRDLDGTPFLEIAGPGDGAGPMVTLGTDGTALRLTLDCPASLPEPAALALTRDLARLCADPRRLLL